MTLAPPRLPVPVTDQRTFRQPPLPGMTLPASGDPAMKLMNAVRSASDQTSAAYRWKTAVSATVRTQRLYGNAVEFARVAYAAPCLGEGLGLAALVLKERTSSFPPTRPRRRRPPP